MAGPIINPIKGPFHELIVFMEQMEEIWVNRDYDSGLREATALARIENKLRKGVLHLTKLERETLIQTFEMGLWGWELGPIQEQAARLGIVITHDEEKDEFKVK